MVEILQRAPSSGDRFARAFAGLGSSLAKDIPAHLMEQRNAKDENAAIKRLIGKDISGVKDPVLRQKYVDMALQAANQATKHGQDLQYQGREQKYGLDKLGLEQSHDLGKLEKTHGYGLEKLGKEHEYTLAEGARKHGQDLQYQGRTHQHELDKEKAKRAGEYEADSENYGKIQEAFGDKFADVWLATGQGERTNLIKAALEARSRGIDIDKMLSAAQNQPQNPNDNQIPVKKGEVPGYNLNTSGMTPKETVEYKTTLRKENMPIWKDTIDQVKDFKELDRDISVLDKINEKKNLPEGLEKLLIDPETGAPYPLGTVIKSPSKDVQQWVKTIARQATRAQTAFPGRVTNFDLTSYMRQFPGLFNTYDGRKVILKQMQLTNKANLLISSALDKVYAKHKLSGITPEDAFEQAKSMVDEDISDIDRQLIELAGEGEILSEPAKALSGKMIDVLGPDGKMYEIDESEVGQLPEGYRVQ